LAAEVKKQQHLDVASAATAAVAKKKEDQAALVVRVMSSG